MIRNGSVSILMRSVDEMENLAWGDSLVMNL